MEVKQTWTSFPVILSPFWTEFYSSDKKDTYKPEVIIISIYNCVRYNYIEMFALKQEHGFNRIVDKLMTLLNKKWKGHPVICQVIVICICHLLRQFWNRQLLICRLLCIVIVKRICTPKVTTKLLNVVKYYKIYFKNLIKDQNCQKWKSRFAHAPAIRLIG